MGVPIVQAAGLRGRRLHRRHGRARPRRRHGRRHLQPRQGPRATGRAGRHDARHQDRSSTSTPRASCNGAACSPEQMRDVLALMGDASDNIPGVPGIGEKTAVKLIAQYGSLENLLAHADEIKGKVGENLRAHKEDALQSRDLVHLDPTAPSRSAWRTAARASRRTARAWCGCSATWGSTSSSTNWRLGPARTGGEPARSDAHRQHAARPWRTGPVAGRPSRPLPSTPRRRA